MNMILQILEFVGRRRWIIFVIGLVLGLLLGLVYAYRIVPVELSNTTPGSLRSDFRDDYILWVARNYESESVADPEWARHKLLGKDYASDARKGTIGRDVEQMTKALSDLATSCQGGQTTKCSAGDAARLEDLAGDLKAIETGGGGGGQGFLQILRSLGLVCLVLLVAAAVVGGALYGYTRLRGRRAEAEEARGAMAERFRPAEPVAWGPDGPPLAQFPTTYTLGDDHYDPSFSVELENGEFMGECGVGVSETIGVGAPNKVTAFEVWLFDKSDIRTVTKVLMSDYAFNDEALRTKLAPKGEPVLAEDGQEVMLETKTLRVRARVVEAKYGIGNLPPNSFFERLTIDLVAWVRGVPGVDEQLVAGDDAEFIPSVG